jgi:hypothetical protein
MAPEVLCSENYAEPADVFRSVITLISPKHWLVIRSYTTSTVIQFWNHFVGDAYKRMPLCELSTRNVVSGRGEIFFVYWFNCKSVMITMYRMAWHQFNALFQYSIKTSDPKFQNGVHSLSGFWLIDVLKEILSQGLRLQKYLLPSMNKISRQQYLGNHIRISFHSNSIFIMNICKSNKQRTRAD